MHQNCHDCGYDLTGLPDKGRCPECGVLYDKHSVYRVMQANQPEWTRHIKWVFLAAFTGLVLICGGALAIDPQRRKTAIAMTLIIAAVSGFGAFSYWWAQRQERRGSD